jgi:hypothetical protein
MQLITSLVGVVVEVEVLEVGAVVVVDILLDQCQ